MAHPMQASAAQTPPSGQRNPHAASVPRGFPNATAHGPLPGETRGAAEGRWTIGPLGVRDRAGAAGAVERRRDDNPACAYQRRGHDLKNGLLACLPKLPQDAWRDRLELVQLPRGKVLYESGLLPTHAYFPTTAIVSLLYVTQAGSTSEMAVVGLDGMVGIGLFMGGNTTTNCAVVQCAGAAYRLGAQDLKSAFDSNGPLRHLLLRYTQALITQISQTAVCNRHHPLHQQLCRWLLLSLDRIEGDELVVTQEAIAQLLGVRRESVTEEAGKLRAERVIEYRRGRITVINRRRLETGSCECYAVVKREFDRLLPRQLAS